MGVKRWLKHKARSVLGTEEILAALSDRGNATAENKVGQHYARLLDPNVDVAALGYRKDQVPCLIEINGDYIWLPGDLLPFVWHTHVAGPPALVPRFLIETPHYIWIRERLRPGDIALDCGSNIGLFSLMMAQQVGPTGQVHAFEPSPRTYRDLGRVLRMNEASMVVTNECALAEVEGQAEFFDVQKEDVRRESSHLTAAGTESDGAQLPHLMRTVKTITLDQYANRNGLKPQLIKIDVEGAEFRVLEGGRQMIKATHPLLVIEFHGNDAGKFDHPRLAAYLNENGYHYVRELKTYYCW